METRFKAFTILLSKINKSIRKIKTEEVKIYNLKGIHVSYLYYIYLEGSITAVQLCHYCGEDKAAVSRNLEYLEQNGFIKCNSKTKKRYNSTFELTEKGYEAGNHIFKKVDETLELANAGIDENDRLIMYRTLSKLNDNLTKICEEYED